MNKKKLAHIATDTNRFDIDNHTNCWNWKGAKNKSGHGAVRVGKRVWLAHRALYTFHIGPILGALVAHHICYTPSCVNPSHILVISRTQHNKFHALHRCKLDVLKVEEIRRFWIQGDKSQSRIAQEFGVHQSTISLVVRNLIWRTPTERVGLAA